MVDLYDLNTRHQAAFFWGSIALLIVVLKFPDVRRSISNLLLAFFKPSIFLSVVGLLLTTVAISPGGVYVGKCLGAFETPPVVTSAIWSCTSGIFLMVAKIRQSQGERIVGQKLAETLAPAAILSILLNFSVMGIWWEIGTFPLVTAVGFLAGFASLREEYSPATRLLNRALVIWALVMLSRTVHSLINSPGAWISLVESLVYPMWLSLGALPYVYLVAQYDKIRFILGRKSKNITAEEYGDRWPLTVDKAKLCCRHSAVWVESSRKKYRLNGLSKGTLERYGYTVYELEDWNSPVFADTYSVIV